MYSSSWFYHNFIETPPQELISIFLLLLKVRMTSGILVMIFKLVKELLKMESI